MEIGRKDVVWNFLATMLRIASGVIVLPAALRLLSVEDYAIWTVFLVVGSVVTLMDFGFSNSFTRNVTYVFNGIKELKTTGYQQLDQRSTEIDYGLLKSLIRSMRVFYATISVLFLVVFSIASPFYLTSLLSDYTSDTSYVWFSWFLYGILTAYSLYTFYYGPILLGRGMIKEYHQNVVIGQLIRITTIFVLLSFGVGLMSLVIGQFIGDVITRTLSYFRFYNSEIKAKFKSAVSVISVRETLKLIAPNSIQIGLTTVGSFLNVNATIFLASMYLTYAEIGSFGVTKMMVDVITSLGLLWFNTYYPKVTSHRVNNDTVHLKRMYLKSKIILIATFIICGFGLILVGPELIQLINSNTQLLPVSSIALMLVLSFFYTNHAFAAQLLLTKNEVPFTKASLLSGIFSVLLLYICLNTTNLGVLALILVPGIVQSSYQNWKWPYMVIKELGIELKDYKVAAWSLKDELKAMLSK